MNRDTLLVIDDSPLDLAILREIFKSLFHVECFEESRPALSYIHRNSQRICAILLDICLGKRGAGFPVLQQLQTVEATADLPVILITSDARKEYVLSGVDKGASDFLVKPLSPVSAQERVCSVVRNAWPTGSTILDHSLQAAQTPQLPVTPQEPSLADHWNRLLDLFFQNRPGLSPHKYHLLGQITQALANGLRKVKPSCGLSPSEVLLIGQAAVFCDIGLLGIPDDILLHGPEQGGSGQNIYFQHTTLGHALFTTGPSSAHPLARYAAEIAYWHHKNYDGTGYPLEAAPNPLPISAQLVHTALRCMDYLEFFQGYPDRLDRSLRALASDVGRALDSDLYQAAQVAREELMACLSDRQPT